MAAYLELFCHLQTEHELHLVYVYLTLTSVTLVNDPTMFVYNF